jgi:serine/threonine protein kinase
MEVANSLTGSIIAERYQLSELLGSGGSGSTYRATRISDGAEVAIKILSLRHLNDWKQLELFEREAKVLSQLSHPQIPQYLEYFHVDTPSNRAFYIVQQLAPGKPLTGWVNAGWRGTEAEVRDIASQLLAILQYLHQQSPPLIHRDIKPHNIIRNDDGQVFLVDFGAVQDVYHNTLMKGSTVAGTYGYMAPEQFRGMAVPSSDLYGLGATLLYLLTHRSPADLPQERLKIGFRGHVNIANHFADWLEMILEPDTADRFASATAALEALRKEQRFRVQSGTKVGFPWRGAAAALAVSLFALPLSYQYRYAFLTVVGLQPRDLCTAIEQNDLIPLNEYLNHGGSANANVTIYDSDLDGYSSGSLLHCAIEHDRIDIAKSLLQRGADPNELNNHGSTVLHQVVNKHHHVQEYTAEKSADLTFLIDKKTNFIDKQDFIGKKINSGCPEQKISKFLNLLIGYKANINAKDSSGESPLLLAVKTHNVQAVSDLLRLGANPHTTNRNNSNLWHVLAWHRYPYQADKKTYDEYSGSKYSPNAGGHSREKSYSGQAVLEIAQELTDAKVDLNAFNNSNDIPLHTALRTNNKTLFEKILNQTKQVEAKNAKGQTLLIHAIENKQVDFVKILVDKVQSVNTPDKFGKTPLMVAISTANSPPATVYPASSENSKLVTPDASPYSPHDSASSVGSTKQTIEIIGLLMAHGADPNLADENGNTALHLLDNLDIPALNCVKQNSLAMRVLDLLVSQKANPQLKNKVGNTALHIMAENELFLLVKRMISYGWKPSEINDIGKSPLSIMANIYEVPVDTMKILLTSGKSNVEIINHQDSNGNTLLHNLLLKDSEKNVKFIKMLIESGADLKLSNKQGKSAFDILPSDDRGMYNYYQSQSMKSSSSGYQYRPINPISAPDNNVSEIHDFIAQCNTKHHNSGGK